MSMNNLKDIVEPIYDEYLEEACEEITFEKSECLVIYKALVILREDFNEEWLWNIFFKTYC